ncbi:unnamed protein product, partial [Hapterophycus canaliculatus]
GGRPVHQPFLGISFSLCSWFESKVQLVLSSQPANERALPRSDEGRVVHCPRFRKGPHGVSPHVEGGVLSACEGTRGDGTLRKLRGDGGRRLVLLESGKREVMATHLKHLKQKKSK